MVDLAKHPKKRRQMGENGYHRVISKYKVEDMEQTYRDIYWKFEDIDW